MKKSLCTAMALFAITTLGSCGNGGSDEEFKPALDTNTTCRIKVDGDYDNFEALIAEFDRFRAYYPNVKLTYTKIDDYKNMLGTVLEGKDKPNIFFSYTWMNDNEKYATVVDHMLNLADPTYKLNLGCIRPGLINRDKQGRTLMLPVFSRTYGMLVNDDLFKAGGFKIPSTWEELLNVSVSLKEAGYKSPLMGFSKTSSSCWMNTVAYPMFLAKLANNPTALAAANNLESSAGEYMRDALTAVKKLVDSGSVNHEECDKIANNYGDVILRFFEGDVPMMVCTADTVSGTKKRESQSEAFVKKPFGYSFHPIPVTNQGGYFIDSPSVEFSINKDCENLDMTCEFMRFLMSNKELNNMASIKRLVPPTSSMSSDTVYAPFGNIPTERTFSPEALGVKDPLTVQIRNASFMVAKGELSIDEAIAKYGQL